MSNFLSVAFGIVTILMGQITTLSAWVTGSQVIQGNTFYDNTNNVNSEYVGLQIVAKHKATGFDFQTNGSQTGAVISADGLNEAQFFSQQCNSTGNGQVATASGGTNGAGGYYNTCVAKNPAGASGSLAWYRFGCKGPRLSITSLSGGYLLASVASGLKTTGSAIFSKQLNSFKTNRTVGTGGSVFISGTGGYLWNPADVIVFQTPTVIKGTFDCRFDYQFARNYAF